MDGRQRISCQRRRVPLLAPALLRIARGRSSTGDDGLATELPTAGRKRSKPEQENRYDMRNVKVLGLAVVAVLAFGVVAVASASAEEFVATVEGAKYTGKALNVQTFKDGGVATVECTALKPEGTVKKLKSVEEEVSVKYENCKIAGIGAATVTLADYTFLTASSLLGRGTSILKVNITITTALPKCSIVVSFGQAFHGAGEIEYKNNSASTVEVKANVKGIVSEVTASESELLCGKVGEKNANGTYTGNSEVGEEGGSIQIK